MRTFFALVLLLPLLLTGCLEIFFASPMELGGGGGWEEIGNINSGIGNTEIKLAFDGNGTLFGVYFDSSNNNILKVFQYNPGDGFRSLGAPAHETVSGLDLAISPNNALYISYASNTVAGGILCSVYDGNWTTSVVAAATYANPKTSLAFDNNDVAMVFCHKEPSIVALYKNTNGTPWKQLLSINTGNAGDHDIRMQIAGNLCYLFAASFNNPMFAFLTNLSGSAPYTYYNPVATNGAANSATCLLDNNGILHAPYIDNINDYIVFSKLETAFWNYDPASTSLFPQNNNIKSLRATASPARDRLFIAWQNEAASGAAPVFLLEYATGNPGWKRLSPPDAGPAASLDNYAIAFNPRDGFIYMAAVVPIHEGAATWDLRLFRYIP